MKKDWSISRLQDICESMNGIWKGVKGPFVTARILRTTNFTKDCQMRLDDLAILDVEKKKMDARKLQKGDIVVEKSGGGPKQPVGRVILFNLEDTDYSFCNFTSALRIKDRSIILPEYLYKYLVFLYFDGATEAFQSNLVGFRNLDFKGYLSLEIRYPSLNEQKSIVVTLNEEFTKIDALRANAYDSLNNLSSLYDSSLKKILSPQKGWITMKLGEFAHMKAGDFIKASDIHEEYYEGSYPCYGGNGLRGYVDEPNRNGEFCLIGRQGALCGNVHMVEGVFRATEHAVVVTPYQQIPTKLVYYLLVSLDLNRFSTGAAQPGLSVKNIADNAIISIPPQKDWDGIIETLDKLDTRTKELEQNYLRTIALCDALKQSLLKKAFCAE